MKKVVQILNGSNLLKLPAIKIIGLLLCIFFSSLALNAQNNFQIKKWDVLDIPFQLEENKSNLHDQSFGAVFMHESGKKLPIDGFYNGKGEFILRASFSLEGTWKYTTYSQINTLNGKTGIINVLANNNKHGSIRVSKSNPQKFCYQDGTPYFALAFEIDWLFALDCNNPDNIPKTRNITSAIKKNGFNQVVMNVYAYDVSWPKREAVPGTDFSKPKTFPFRGTNEKPDYSSLNYDFFNHLDRVIKHLDEQGIVSHLMIYVWNKKVNWPQPGSKADNMYFDYVIKRYQAFTNIIWNISKEALMYGRDDMNYVTKKIHRIRKLDAYNRLITVHDYNYCKAFPQEVDFISIQNHSPNLYNITLAAKQKYPDKPILNIEHGGYETTIHQNFKGTYSDPVICLSRSYISAFAGAYSNYYWQNTAWQEVISKPFELPEPQQPHFHYYGYLNKLFEKYNYNRLEPILMDQSTFCLTDKETVYLFYLPVGLERISGKAEHLVGKTVKWTIFDPLTGQYHEQNTKKFENRWIVYFKPENISDSILIGILEVVD